MFSDPQFWVAVSFFLFIAAIFNPVRKILKSSLDSQINEIKNKLSEAENLKIEAQNTLSELKNREAEVENELQKLKLEAELKIKQLQELSTIKLSDQIQKREILAQNKIEQLLRDANLNIKNYISSIAIETCTKILQNNLTVDKKSNLINESIKELDATLKI